MLYYLIRIIFLVLLILASIIIFKKSRNLPVFSAKIVRTPNGDYVKRKYSKQIIIQAIIVTLLFLISFLPFEGPFIRFKSTEDSLKYSVYDYNLCEYEIIEDGKCDFVFSYRYQTDCYSISKYDDGFSLANYDCSINSYYYATLDDKPPFKCSAKSVYNKYADKSCLFIIIEPISKDENLEIVYDDTLLTDYYIPYGMSRMYCFVTNGKIDSKSINFLINDDNIKFSKLF